jgi:hypothetical protein
MTADLPFLHPAEDPSIETTTQAWSRVDRTVRLRRAQRRTVGSALLAVAVLGAVAAFGATGGDAGYETAYDDLMIDADTGWTDPVLSEDEMRLTIMVGSAPAGDTSCSENYEHQVVETDQSVTIELERLPTPRDDPDDLPEGSDGFACTAMEQSQALEVTLDAPLGDREVFDGVQSEPQAVHRRAELVDVTYVPDGFTAQEPIITDDVENGWSQLFTTEADPIWDLWIDQRPAAGAPTPEGTPTPVTVHGTEGVRYSGQWNNTSESIVWVEGDIRITIRGEGIDPPFTHGAKLLAVAEGIRLPS